MIFLHKPYIKQMNNKSRLIFEIDIDNENKTVFFEVEKKYEKYLCDDRVDAIVIGILSYAMRNNHDIKSDSFITDEIYYKLTEYLIPSLVNYSQNLKMIKIDISTKKVLKTLRGGVGAGCSCGVDSMYAIFHDKNKILADLKITHLCINNVGAFNECYKKRGIEKVREERIKKAQSFAKELGIPLIISNSNFSKEIHQNHLLTHTYSSTFAILCMQKLWRVYFYGSSGYDFSKFSLENNDEVDCSHYELLSLDCFSTSSLKIYSDGGALTRIDKIRDIADNDFVKKYLHVCTVQENNCNVCDKCR